MTNTDSADDEIDLQDEGVATTSRHDLVRLGVLVEGGMVVLAIVISYFGFFDHSQPLSELDWPAWQDGIVFGLLGTIPMLGYLVVFHYWEPEFYAPMRDFVRTYLVPLFSKCSLLELLLLSVLAGLGEELLFRWCLQGGIAWAIGEPAGVWVGLAVASVLFGMCHWVNACYGITTAIIGVYLGLMMIWTGSFLSAAIAHALFDFVAFVYLTRWLVKPDTFTAEWVVDSSPE